jgi:hypothetical protein
VKWEKIHLVPMEDGGAQVVLNGSKEEPQDAPVFRSKADQEMERRFEEQRRQWIEDERRLSRLHQIRRPRRLNASSPTASPWSTCGGRSGRRPNAFLLP